MAQEWIIDPKSLDLSVLEFTKEDVLQYCKQRGSFELIDGVVHFDENRIAGFKALNEGDWWTHDHIPGRPIFPGVLMIEACAQLCSFHYLKSYDRDPNVFIGYGGLNKVRFRGVVEPGSPFIMAAQVKRARTKMFIYTAQGFAGDRLVFETEILGAIF